MIETEDEMREIEKEEFIDYRKLVTNDEFLS
jgi:hypothetical protein